MKVSSPSPHQRGEPTPSPKWSPALATHQKQCNTVEHKECLEDLVQLVEAFHIVQVLTDMEQVQEFAHVPVTLNLDDQGLPCLTLVERGHTGHQVQDVVQLVQLAWRELWDGQTVVKPVRYVPVFGEIALD